MNIHPIFVHFPIALLTLYAVLEIAIPLKIKFYKLCKWDRPETSPRLAKLYQLLITPVWNPIKAFLVIVGTVLTFVTLQKGEWAEEIYRSRGVDGASQIGRLIETHSTFADLTMIVFSILAIGYLTQILWNTYTFTLQKYTFIQAISNIILHPKVAPLLAFLGIIAVTITGALGGAISHGANTDPVVQMIYNLFF